MEEGGSQDYGSDFLIALAQNVPELAIEDIKHVSTVSLRQGSGSVGVNKPMPVSEVEAAGVQNHSGQPTELFHEEECASW